MQNEFKQRRERVLAAIDPGVLVISAAPLAIRLSRCSVVAALATPRNGHVGEVDGEAEVGGQRIHDDRAGFRPNLPGLATAGAVHMPVDVLGQDVVVLAAVRAMAMFDQPELLQHVQRSIDGGWGRGAVTFAATADQLSGSDVAPVFSQDIDQGASLRRPPQTTGP